MFKSIVVGTDGSDTATQAVQQAVDLAGASAQDRAGQRIRARLLAAAQRGTAPGARGPAVGDQPARGRRRDARGTPRSRRATRACEVDVYARQGDPADAILDVAEEQEADLIIVGNKGMTGAKRFLLGSVPNKVSHHAPCSVLIIRTT